MFRPHKIFSILILLALLTLPIATPAYAFDGRSGDKVIVQSGDIVNDDLYVGANEFVLDGTVNGDVIAAGQMITINGTINGNLMAAGQTIVINGTVTGASRIAGSVLFVGEKASIGKDILGAGYSLESRKGSAIGRDVIFAGGQVLMAGNVARNVQVATGGLEIAGNVGGDVRAEVGEANSSQSGPPPAVFMGQSTVPVPQVKPGLTIDPSAKISGNLDYTQNNDLTFPAGVVAGKISRTVPSVNQNSEGRSSNLEATPAQKIGNWSLNLLRSLVTLILIGLLLLWLAPALIKKPTEKLETKLWPSLAWGVVAYAAFFFAVLLILFVLILGGILFGALTLGSLSGTVIWLGILALFALIVGFVLVTSFVAKVVFGMALGKWILTQTKSPLAGHGIWPMVIGVAITVVVVALLSFPLIPGLLGGLLNFVVILFGLGAIWMWGRDAMSKRPKTPAA
jgi:cytoskeletal protein CcmA (bactofilin family)